MYRIMNKNGLLLTTNSIEVMVVAAYKFKHWDRRAGLKRAAFLKYAGINSKSYEEFLKDVNKETKFQPSIIVTRLGVNHKLEDNIHLGYN